MARRREAGSIKSENGALEVQRAKSARMWGEAGRRGESRYYHEEVAHWYFV